MSDRDIRREMLAASGGQAQDVADSYAKSQREIAALNDALKNARATEFTAESEEKLVSVTVNGMSELRGVYISPTGMRKLTHEELGPIVLQTLQQARLIAVQGLGEAMEGVTGVPLPSGKDMEISKTAIEDFRATMRDAQNQL